MRIVILAMLAAGIAQAAPLTTAEVVTGRDITVRYKREDTCRWWRGQTATQPQRAAMFLAGAARFVPDAIRAGRAIPACAQLARGKWSSTGFLGNLDMRLRTMYTDISRDKEWSLIGGGCGEYEIVATVGTDLQTCATANAKSATACAQSLDMTGDLLAWADLRIEQGRCVKGARFDLVIPGVEDKQRALAGHLIYREPLPPLTDAQMALWTKALHLHHQSDDAACGEGPKPATSVRQALLDFENSATDERQKHAFQVHEFDTNVDPTWSLQDVCDIKRLEGAAMTELDRCFHLPGNVMWACLTRARASHETIHRIGALNNAGVIRIGTHADRPQLTSTQPRTPRQWLDCAINPALGCRPVWVPADWRTIVGAGE